MALQTTNFELNYERSSRAVESVVKDEDIRKLKYQVLGLEDENEELIEQLDKEEVHVQNLERDLECALARYEELDNEIQRLNEELRVRLRESSTMRVC
jgi:chromosome segregation ATPase